MAQIIRFLIPKEFKARCQRVSQERSLEDRARAKASPTQTSKGEKMTIDEKWEIVREYFEKYYKDIDGKRIQFKQRIADDKIELFYWKIQKLSQELDEAPQLRAAKAILMRIQERAKKT